MDNRLLKGTFVSNEQKFINQELAKEGKKLEVKTEEFIGKTFTVVNKD